MKNIFKRKTVQFGFVFLIGFTTSIFVQDRFSSTNKSDVDQVALSEIENKLREEISKLKNDYNVELGLVRKKNQLVLRLWDDQVFGINDWTISKKGKKIIKEISKSLQSIDEKVKFEISSHYDSVDPGIGNSMDVNKISITTHRAAKIAGVLAGTGLDMKRLYIKGYGNSQPLFKDRDLYGQYIAQAGELNRRLEIKVVQGETL